MRTDYSRLDRFRTDFQVLCAKYGFLVNRFLVDDREDQVPEIHIELEQGAPPRLPKNTAALDYDALHRLGIKTPLYPCEGGEC